MALTTALEMSMGQDETAIADTGHAATHAPQPVQRSRSIAGVGAAPGAGRKPMARASQRSAHAEQTTRFSARQLEAIEAFRAQGAAAAR